MNKKIRFLNAFGQEKYCVFSPNEDLREQWEKVLGVEKGQGFSVDVKEDRACLVDYFHGETRAEFIILSVEDTDLEVNYVQTSPEN
jgi:hypothetical protein